MHNWTQRASCEGTIQNIYSQAHKKHTSQRVWCKGARPYRYTHRALSGIVIQPCTLERLASSHGAIRSMQPKQAKTGAMKHRSQVTSGAAGRTILRPGIEKADIPLGTGCSGRFPCSEVGGLALLLYTTSPLDPPPRPSAFWLPVAGVASRCSFLSPLWQAHTPCLPKSAMLSTSALCCFLLAISFSR